MLEQYLNIMINKSIVFNKEPTNRWYADVPEWTGDKADLEMVAGADDMLNYMSEGEDRVRVFFTLEPVDGFDSLELKYPTPEVGGGVYFMKTHNGIEINQEMWLCDVTKFVFGGILPPMIYLKKTEY